MKQQFVVAHNAFTVTTPDGGLPAWQALATHFCPFEVDASCIVHRELSINLNVGKLPMYDAEAIYEPDYGGIGLVASRALRLPDGCLVLEFRHVNETQPRISMKVSPQQNEAVIVLAPDGDRDDPYFLTHAVMIAYLLATAANGTLVIHASAVLLDGKAYLFQGKSGTGKSTHAALWTKHIAGAELMNDDHPMLRIAHDGAVIAYGSPWSGKTYCYRNEAAPVAAFVRLRQAPENALRRLDPLRAYASLTASVFYLPFLNEAQRAARHAAIEQIAASIPCCEMGCRPDADAAITCHNFI